MFALYNPHGENVAMVIVDQCMAVCVGMERRGFNLRKPVGMVTVSVEMETTRLEFEKACRDGDR